MLVAEPTVWGIHAGVGGEAEDIFLKENNIAIGWDAIGDLRQWQDRDSLKQVVAEAYPDNKPGAIPVHTGVLYRFAHEMQVGDYVAYPCKSTREVWIGRITGEYEYDQQVSGYPHRRRVDWMKNVPRTALSQGALYSISSMVTQFRIGNHAEEFVALAEGEPTPALEEDDTVLAVARDIEEQTRDFIIKQLATHLKGHPLADFVADILSALGYQTQVSPPGPDHGIDIIAHPDELGFESPRVKIQVKSSLDSIGEAEVSQLYGKVDTGEFGLFVALGTFKGTAKTFALNKGNLRLIDGEELVKLILRHYEELDSRYKAIMPLKKAYIPEAVEHADE